MRLLKIKNRQSQISNGHQPSGDNSAVAPPVPIPNTAVKRCSPDGSTAIGRARVGRRQNKNPDKINSSGFLLSGEARMELRGSERHRRSGSKASERERTSQLCRPVYAGGIFTFLRVAYSSRAEGCWRSNRWESWRKMVKPTKVAGEHARTHASQ